MTKPAQNNASTDYLSIRERDERIKFLKRLNSSEKFLPVDLVEDLMCLELGSEEHCALIQACGSSNPLEIEDFITRNFYRWDQDIAIAAVTRWTTHTDQILSHRWACFNEMPELPQRIRYSFVNQCHMFGGRRILDSNIANFNMSDFSSAFISLLLLRAAQWQIHSSKLLDSCQTIFAAPASSHIHERAVAEAINYIACQSPANAEKLMSPLSKREPWGSIVAAVLDAVESRERRTKDWFKNFGSKNQQAKKIIAAWPSIWMRQSLTQEMVNSAVNFVIQNSQKPKSHDTSAELPSEIQLLCGMPEEMLKLAIGQANGSSIDQRLIKNLSSLLGPDFQIKSTNQNSFLSGTAYPETDIRRAFEEREKILAEPTSQFDAIGPSKWSLKTRFQNAADGALSDSAERRQFFNCAFRNQTTEPSSNQSIWSLLTKAWTQPQQSLLDELASAARKEKPVVQIAYIQTLGRFKGIEAAVLKLLDYTRSTHEAELLTLVRSLSGIGNSRALQELVSCLTRPNFSLACRMEVANLLARHELSSVQDELRSALDDLHLDQLAGSAAEKAELLEAMEALVKPLAINKVTKMIGEPAELNAPKIDLDVSLASRIPGFSSMSSEVKRALRTAEFFHKQVYQTKTEDTIDLSPLIDMQYKALELTFREQFEDPCNRVINTGIIQRKLDVIGYARPIPAQMDQFEGYIAGLPVFNSIPYFSKFKMRKMLRSLCQFRPGKRFTLDGLKAFAIFFACFSRKSCRFGLENIFPMPYRSDEDMAQFVKILHVFQDFRNRAAHEGFQPDAKNNVTGIWQSTAEIFTNVQLVDQFLRSQNNRPQTRNRFDHAS
jgi:hypothetical protein